MPEEVFQKYNWPDKPVRIEPSSRCSDITSQGKPWNILDLRYIKSMRKWKTLEYMKEEM